MNIQLTFLSPLKKTILLLTLLIVTNSLKAQSVKIFRDSTFNFSAIKTYKFKPGKLILNGDTVDRDQTNSNILTFFESYYHKHHLTFDAKKGQLIFTFLGGIQSQEHLAAYGQQIRLPKGIVEEASKEWSDDDQPFGVLILALINPKTKKPVWVAVGYDRFFTRESQKKIEGMFIHAFEDFPNKGSQLPKQNTKTHSALEEPQATKKKG